MFLKWLTLFFFTTNAQPLEDFCKDIISEIRLIINLRLPPTEEWMIGANNFPCGPAFGMNAIDLANKSLEEVRDIFREQAREGDQTTGSRTNPSMMARKRDPDSSVAVEQ
jgi:hypothetical protein